MFQVSERTKFTFRYTVNAKTGRKETHCYVDYAPVVGSENVYTFHGIAECASDDMFDKSVGRKLALERAIEYIDKEERSQIWSTYHTKIRR